MTVDGLPAPVVLVAHGSRDPRAAAATRGLVRAVAAARPGRTVRASYLDHTAPTPAQVLRELESAGHRRAVVVPLLLTDAYHGRVDVPGAVAAARADGLRMPVRITGVVGPVGGTVDELLVAGLRRRLAESTSVDRMGYDGVVLAAAGTRDAAARRTVDAAAAALGADLALPCLAGYASAALPTVAEAVSHLRAAGARRVAVAAYFLAPGRLYGVAETSGRAAGAVVVAGPLGELPELARLVLARVRSAESVAGNLLAMAATAMGGAT
ncbi:sirohydrochlorin chelatase [Micromonospora polyrhachis]|uniref:Sirohydrochlorin ferrochelatase n=1 Tax=Micromonospora polyrhachis TaxID=1282883 RepID=A0A7W7WQC0_9ACTN|nr:sirohydrochlorin ferrochelatase [Micromonospora polyrhachis]